MKQTESNCGTYCYRHHVVQSSNQLFHRCALCMKYWQHMTSMSSKPEPRNISQRIPCLDSSQLNITWISCNLRLQLEYGHHLERRRRFSSSVIHAACHVDHNKRVVWFYSGAPYPYWKVKETCALIFSWLSWIAVLLVGAYVLRRRLRSRARWRPYSSW